VTVFRYLILISIDFYDFSLVLVSIEKIYQTLKTVFDHISKPSRLPIRIARLNFVMFFQSVIVAFFLNIFSRVINLLLTKLARDRTGRISALGLFCTLRSVRTSVRYSPRTALALVIRYINLLKNAETRFNLF